MNGMDADQLIPFLAKEHPQTVALVLSNLDPARAGAILDRLSDRAKADVARRIARLGRVSPEVMQRLEQSLGRELDALLSGQSAPGGGPSVLARILSSSGRATESTCMSALDKSDAALAEAVREERITFTDLVHLTDRDLQAVLSEVDVKDLAVALKGEDAASLRDRVMPNLSERVGGMLREQMQFSGPVRLSDVKEARRRIMKLVYRLEEEGKITVSADPSSEVFL
jgi:flagellar motor switch protein FliG